jgi:hypothetical protein
MPSLRFACPYCGSLTLDEEPPGTYAICPVRFWEDDLVQFQNPDYEGGVVREAHLYGAAVYLDGAAAVLGPAASRLRTPMFRTAFEGFSRWLVGGDEGPLSPDFGPRGKTIIEIPFGHSDRSSAGPAGMSYAPSPSRPRADPPATELAPRFLLLGRLRLVVRRCRKARWIDSRRRCVTTSPSAAPKHAPSLLAWRHIGPMRRRARSTDGYPDGDLETGFRERAAGSAEP